MASNEFHKLIEVMKARPRPATPPTLEEQRQGMEMMSGANPLPDDVTVEKVDAGGVPGEWVAAPGADVSRGVLYLHGGGYVLGSINTHRELASRISRSSGARVLIIDYRLAPEHPFPAAVDDATGAYRWMLTQGVGAEKAAIAGDSAGGGLTVATLLALRDEGAPLPAAGVCLSPWVDMEGLGDSMTSQAEKDSMVAREGLLDMAKMYLNGADPRTPLAAPLHADLTGLPPLLIQVGTAETLMDDSTRLAEKARAAGVEVVLEPWDEMIHVFQAFSRLPEAIEATNGIGEYLQARMGAAVA